MAVFDGPAGHCRRYRCGIREDEYEQVKFTKWETGLRTGRRRWGIYGVMN